MKPTSFGTAGMVIQEEFLCLHDGHHIRVLPPGSNQKLYTIYRVLKPIDNIAACKIMPWFGEIGLGTQYELSKSIKLYTEAGHLEEVK